MSRPPASAPYALPMPPTTTAAKMLRISEKPRLGFTTPGGQRIENARQPGEPGARRPGDQDDSIGVDPGGLRQLDAVGERSCLPAQGGVLQRQGNESDHDKPYDGNDQLGSPQSELSELDAGSRVVYSRRIRPAGAGEGA